MDQPLFNPSQNEDKTYPETQDISLNLNNQTQSQGNDNYISTPFDSPQIQTTQINNNNNETNLKTKKSKIYLTELNTFCIPFEENSNKCFPYSFLL